ncbi:MAG: cytochrome c biogenesis protein ResB [Bdellovibrionales bacterium]|nr:cytochrome c biogenesis protein ResB [Bdellovibrionales bacterium]
MITKKIFQKLYSFSISLKLSVVTFILLGILTAVGTYMESLWDQETANKLIYHSPLMTGVMILLVINLSAVLVDRWPWKTRQIPFILAHFGILIMIFGSTLTRHFGLDASLRFKEGETVQKVTLTETEVVVYSSFDGESFTQLYHEPVDFYFNRPSESKPVIIPSGSESFLITTYIPYGLPREEYQASQKGGWPALRFYLEGRPGRFVEWLFLPPGQKMLKKQLGPAEVIFTTDRSRLPETKKNQLLLYAKGEQLFYSLEQKRWRSLKPGQVFATGWMDFQFRLLDFFPKARRVFTFSPQKRPSDNTLSAIQVSWKGEKAWVAQGAYVQFYEKDKMYALGYLNQSHPLTFPIKLLDFRMETYQGSNKAKTYESEVEILGKKYIISMNEPLKTGGYTFYQSGFEEDDEGRPVISILSVNKDPGRFVKYTGAGLVILGVGLLFYRRKKLFGRKL